MSDPTGPFLTEIGMAKEIERLRAEKGGLVSTIEVLRHDMENAERRGFRAGVAAAAKVLEAQNCTSDRSAAKTIRAALAIDAAVEKFIKREDAHAPLVENRPALLALRNVRMLVRRKWGKGIDEEWAEHLIRFCREGGLTDDILRAPRPDDGKTGGGK